MNIKTNRLAALLTRSRAFVDVPLPHAVPVYSYNLGRFSGLAVNRLRRHLARKNVVKAGVITLSVAAVGYTASFLWPRTMAFAFDGSPCITNPVLLPGLISKQASPSYKATPRTSFSVAGYPVYSHSTCLSVSQPPAENTAETILFGTAFFKKNIRVASGTYPTLASQAILEKPVPTQDPLVIELDKHDRVFEYRLLAADKSLSCDKQNESLVCDVADFNLAQSANYDFRLERLFNDKPVNSVFQQTLPTVQSVRVEAASITAGQTVYDTPAEMTLTLNRPVAAMEDVRLYLVEGDSKQEVGIEASLNEQTIIVRFNQPLARSASFNLSIGNLKAADGGFLAEPFGLQFKTSGGPKVVGASIGSYKVSLSGSITLTFDSPVLKSQDIGSFIKLDAGGNGVDSSISVRGNKVTIDPSGSLPRCTALTLRVLDGLKNDYGISGGSGWLLRSRTICQTVFSIGRSVQGRGITAYSFGSGASKIVFVGTTHGDEKSSTLLLNRLIDYLESHATDIPAHRTIVVIPNLNPDGYALGRRTNANNVDLNRNFPTNDWKSGVTMPDRSHNPNGGGSAPLSEPESDALAGYILNTRPRLVLTYHAAAGVVIPNDSGDSVSLAHTYDQKSNVGFASNSSTGAIFHYDTTGAFENWLHESPGIPALLIELWSKTGNEFSRHQSAIWAMVQLP